MGDRCTRHPGARAGWSCRSCGADLCPGCAFPKRVGSEEVVACGRCGALAEPRTVHRSALRSFAARVPQALLYPFSPGTLLGVVAAAGVLALFSYFGVLGAILRYGISWSFLFSIVRQTSRGAPTYEAAELSETGSELVLAALRGFVGIAIIWVPAVVWFAVVHGGSLDVVGGLADPVLWAIVALGVVYAPAALMHAAAGGRTLEMLNPVFILSLVTRFGRDYAILVAALGALWLVDLGVGVAALALRALPVPVVSRVAGELVALLVPVVMARVLGLLLYVRGDAVDYGVPQDYLEPALAGAVPRGREPVLQTTLAAEAPGPAPRDRAPEDEPSPPAQRAPGPPADPARAIAEAVAANDPARAAALFAAYRGPPGAIPPRALFALARAASEAGEHAVAARALHAVATGEDQGLAPNALLVLSRLYERRLGRQADARKVLEHLVARFPTSDAARHARQLLAPGGSSP